MSGQIFVITGPSGVGKGTLCNRLLQEDPSLGLSVSATSRKPRMGEVDGINYHFYAPEEFAEMVSHDESEPDTGKHKLLEWASYNGNYYGTPRAEVQSALRQGRRVILEIETQGALQVRQRFPDAFLIFIAPPNIETLAKRLLGRGTDEPDEIANRLHIAEQELALQNQFDIVLVNDNLDTCLNQLQVLLANQTLRQNALEDMQT